MSNLVDARRWEQYFARFGCLSCKRKTRKHGAGGFCETCAALIYLRLCALQKQHHGSKGR